MNISVNRQLVGWEDMTWGTGTVEQLRGGKLVTVAQINASLIPFDDTRTLGEALDTIDISVESAVDAASVVAEAAIAIENTANTINSRIDETIVAINTATMAATTAENAVVAAEALLDTFDDRYLGAFLTNPITDNDGDILSNGAMYFNDASKTLHIYNLVTSTWIPVPSTTLNSLTDIELTSLAIGDILVWDGIKWLNKTIQSAATGGYTANVYLTNTASVTVPAYNQISYTPGVSEIIQDTVVNNSEAIIGEYIFDADVLVTSIPSGTWEFHFHRYVSNAAGVSNIRFEVFSRTNLGVETILFSDISNPINDLVNVYDEIKTTQPVFAVNATDRLGIRLFAITDRNQDTTISLFIGNGSAAFLVTPLAIRHNLLRNRSEDNAHPISSITGLQSALDAAGGSIPEHNNLEGLNAGNFQHLTTSEKAKYEGYDTSKANKNNPSFTGIVSGITANMVGAEPSDNTILKDADVGTSVLAPNGDGSQLTGISAGTELLFDKALFGGL